METWLPAKPEPGSSLKPFAHSTRRGAERKRRATRFPPSADNRVPKKRTPLPAKPEPGSSLKPFAHSTTRGGTQKTSNSVSAFGGQPSCQKENPVAGKAGTGF